MHPQTSRNGFSAAIMLGRRFDLIEIGTIAVGVVVMTVLAMMF
ncbi:MAG: hypothetical protein WBQ24_12520 [Xanthobacteraceae bacterium]